VINLTLNLKEKTHILMDCDGVTWRGNQPIPGAIEALDNLESLGYQLGFVTNNSSLSRRGFKQKFKTLGFNPTNYTIVNSAYGAAIYLRDNNHKRVFMIGEKGLREELTLKPIYVAEEYEENLQGVCIGWDRMLSWRKLADAMRVILNDKGFFVGTNPDNSFPLENSSLSGDRLVPGAGAGIAALATACGKDPDIIIGKPNRFLVDLALDEMGCSDPMKAVLVGDRLSTDILAGINSGLETLLVRTGISDNHMKNTILPTQEIDSIADILNIVS
jgi:phosphoglycolate/pyridoxal phosphate phosphatase family enzyme